VVIISKESAASILNPEDEGSSFLQDINKTTYYQDPEDQNTNFHHTGNLKYYTLGEDEME
jgi:hypothetical protein